MDVGTLVTRAATRFGDRTAVECEGEQRTFGQLGDRVTRLARALLALGLAPGDRVLDLQENSITAVESDLAIRSAGLVRVALNHRLHATDWERIATDCGAHTIVIAAEHVEAAGALVGGLERVVVVGDGPGRSYESIIAGQTAAPLPPRGPDTFCGLHYSSGTTGHPKGARRTHRNWFASVVNLTHDVLGGVPRHDDVYVHAGPITHTSGLFLLPFLVAGARQVVLPRWDPDAFVEAVAERGGTHTAVVPTMVARLLAHGGSSRDTLAGLRMLAYAGAPMPPEQIRLAYERLTPSLVQYYGLVEAIPPVTVLTADDHARGLGDQPDLLGSAGRTALGVEIAVVDEDGNPVRTDEVGEVITRGDHVMAGYWNSADRAELAKIVRDGWLHTGDLGRLGPDGHLWLVDRKGDMIISGGYNIYPREVEDVVAEVPGVHEVAVLGLPDPDWGQRVVAFYTTAAGATVAEQAIMEHCRSRLASYKKPKELRRLDAFPLSGTGKIAKKTLRASLSLPKPDL